MGHPWEISNRPKSIGIYAVIAAVIVGGLTAFYILSPPGRYAAFAAEDGVAETLTALFYFAAGVILLVAGGKAIKKDRRPVRQIVPFLLALLFIFAAGEEISWGQRLFHLSVPHALEGKTFDNDLSLHNLKIFGYPLLEGNRLLNLFVILTGMILPLAYAVSTKVRKLIAAVNFPIAPLATLPLFLLSLIYGLALSRITHHWAPTEIKEFLFSLGYFLASISVASGKNKTLPRSPQPGGSEG
jgi:hypothetical protein